SGFGLACILQKRWSAPRTHQAFTCYAAIERLARENVSAKRTVVDDIRHDGGNGSETLESSGPASGRTVDDAECEQANGFSLHLQHGSGSTQRSCHGDRPH